MASTARASRRSSAPPSPCVIVLGDSQPQDCLPDGGDAPSPPPPKRRRGDATPGDDGVVNLTGEEEEGGGAGKATPARPRATPGGALSRGARDADSDEVIFVGEVAGKPPAKKAGPAVVDLTREPPPPSTDAAARELLLQNQLLEKQLAEARKLAARLAGPGVQLPPHWTAQSADTELLLRPLPMPGSAPVSGSAKRVAQHKAEVAEVEAVLARFAHAPGGLNSGAVTRVWRVQHKKLYTRYVERREEVAREAARCAGGPHVVAGYHAGTLTGAERDTAAVVDLASSDSGTPGASHPCGSLNPVANERLLWHGADAHTVRLIIGGGFECRISNMSGALGAGNYFAENASYSHQYSAMPPHASAPGAHSHHHRAPPPGHPGHRGGAHHPAHLVTQQTLEQGHLDAIGQLQLPPGELFMVLARVSLGRVGPSANGARIAPPGFQSVGDAGAVAPTAGRKNSIYAVFDNSQCYPNYVLQYTAANVGGGAPGAAGVALPAGMPPGAFSAAMAAFAASGAAAFPAGLPPHLAAAFAVPKRRTKRKHG